MHLSTLFSRYLLLATFVVNLGLVNLVYAVSEPTSLTITSRLFDQPAEFKVTLPASYQEAKDKKYVVMLGLHPASHSMLVGNHEWMSHNGEWPWLESIIITSPDGHEGLGKLKAAAINEKGHQGLLDFFEQDLIPAINKHYRTNGFRILTGFVGDGGLTLYTLINRPQLFNAYVATSPVLSKDFAYVLADMPKQLSKITSPRFLYASTSDSGYEQGQLNSFAELESLLKQHAPNSLNYKIQRFDGSYYMTQPVISNAHAIEMIFDAVHKTVEADSALAQQGAKAVLAHYQYLSDEVYGFEVSATASLSALAKRQYESSPDIAVATLNMAVNAYPQDAHAHAALGAMYLQMGKSALAKLSLDKAMTLTDHPFWLNKWGKLAQQAD